MINEIKPISNIQSVKQAMATKAYGNSLLVFCMVLLQGLVSSTTDKVHFSKRLQVSNDGNTSAYTFEWMLQISKTDCVEACKSTKACEYINYEVRPHVCALIRANKAIQRTIPAVVEQKPGYIFGNKSEWTMDTLAGCDDCSTYGKCTDGNSVCRNSGCGLPRSIRVRGNMFTNGSTVLKACSFVTEHTFHRDVLIPTVCGENGEWLDQYNCLPFLNGSYYYVQTDKLTWNDANTYCESLSGHLAIIGSEEENWLVSSLITEYFWIGGNDIQDEGHFVWVDGSAVSDGYTKWLPLNPDNWLDDEDCMAITELNEWNDDNCSFSHRSVCEFEFSTN